MRIVQVGNKFCAARILEVAVVPSKSPEIIDHENTSAVQLADLNESLDEAKQSLARLKVRLF